MTQFLHKTCTKYTKIHKQTLSLVKPYNTLRNFMLNSLQNTHTDTQTHLHRYNIKYMLCFVVETSAR